MGFEGEDSIDNGKLDFGGFVKQVHRFIWDKGEKIKYKVKVISSKFGDYVGHFYRQRVKEFRRIKDREFEKFVHRGEKRWRRIYWIRLFFGEFKSLYMEKGNLELGWKRFGSKKG